MEWLNICKMTCFGYRVAVIYLLVVFGVLGAGNALLGVVVIARGGRRAQPNIVCLDAFGDIIGIHYL
jgi:hypothetical protein